MEIGEEQDPIEVPVPARPGQVPAAEPEPAAEPVPEPVPGAARYQERPRPFTALQWTGANLTAVQALIGADRACLFRGGPRLLVVTLGDTVIKPDDWVMLLDSGDVDVSSPAAFAYNYELAPDDRVPQP